MTELRNKPAKPAPAETGSGLSAGALTDEELGTIGKENENIKDHCVDVLRKFDELANFRTSFVELFEQIGTILKDREQTKSALVERTMMHALAERAHQELKAEFRDLYEGSEERRAENSLLGTENERLKELVRNSEAHVEVVKAELRQQTEAAAVIRSELERERSQLSHLGDELRSVQSELQKNDAIISQLQVELAATCDLKTFCEQKVETLQANLAERRQSEAALQHALSESQIHAKGLSDKIREMEMAVEAERCQVNDLKALLSSTQTEHLEAQAEWRQEAERARLANAALESQVNKMTAHSQASDGLLTDVRAQLQARHDELRAEARRNQDIESKLSRSNERQEHDAAEIAELKQKLKDKETAQAHLTDRAQAVIKSSRDLKADLEKAEQRAQLVGERVLAETGQFKAQSERFEQTIRELTEKLEKERIARALVEGALEAARQKLAPPR
jgi:crescentin